MHRVLKASGQTAAPGEGLSALVRFLLSVVTGAIVALIVHGSWSVRFIAGWNGLSATQLVLAWWIIQTSGPSDTRRRAEGDELARLPSLVIVLVGSLLSLVLSLHVLRGLTREGLEPRVPLVLLCFSAVILSWWLTHTAYTVHYARVFFRHGGLQFPGDARPDYWDFAYFAFTVGMCFQVSDVVAQASQMRRTVLVHAFLSYIYGVAVLALVVNVIAGMWG